MCLYVAEDFGDRLRGGGVIGVRDGKAGRTGPIVWIRPPSWTHFITAIATDQFTR